MYLVLSLENLHASGYVHGDIKQENIVVIRDDAGSIIGIRFIDLDTLAKEGAEDAMAGTAALFSPDRMQKFFISYLPGDDYPIEADSKDDVWSMMGLICELEWKAIQRRPHQDRRALINPRILRRWNQYATEMFNRSYALRQNLGEFFQYGMQYFERHPPVEGSALFGGIQEEYVLDPLIMAMGRFNRDERASAQKLSNDHFQQIPEGLDEDRGPPPRSNLLQRIRRGFLRCLSCLFCCFQDSRESQ